MTPKPDKNFDDLTEKLKKTIGAEENLTQFIIKHAEIIKYLVNMRNRTEHDPKLIIKNFDLTSCMEITIPKWCIPGEPLRPIHEDMKNIVIFLTQITEDMFIHAVMTCVRKDLSYIVEEIEEKEMNPDMPIKYRLILNATQSLGEIADAN